MENKKEDVRGVNVLDPKELLAYAQDTTDEGRSRLAKAVSQFFEDRALTHTEQQLASEILLNLIRQAELDLREALSERLSLQSNVPPEVIIHLANDQIEVARSVLMHSPVLNDVDLVYIVTARGEEHARIVARRPDLTPVVADKLIDTGDTQTMLNLLDNQRTHLQKGSMKKLVKASLRSEELQAPLLRRPEVDPDIAVDLYMVVSQSLRRELVEKFTLPPQMIEQALDGLVHELSNETRGLREPTADMTALARRFEERKDITADLMIRTLRRGQIGFFVALFSELTKIPSQYVMTLLQRDGGKALVVACRAIGMMKSEFASIFLLSRGIRTGDKIVDQRELAMALKNFDAMRDHDVQRVMSSWLKNPELI